LQRSDCIAVTIPSINHAKLGDTLAGLTEGVQGTGRQVLLGLINCDMAKAERLIEQLLRRRPGAIVVTGGKRSDRARRFLVQAAIPVVKTCDLPPQPVGHVAGIANAAAVRGMVDHPVAQGRDGPPSSFRPIFHATATASAFAAGNGVGRVQDR